DDLKSICTLGYRLLAGQRRPMHLWRYQVPILNEKEERQFRADIRADKFKGTMINDQDMSCSQFAALGLWVARRHGVPVKAVDSALRKAAITARNLQNAKNGTWKY